MRADPRGRSGGELQKTLYAVFLVACLGASTLGIMMVWGFEPTRFMVQILATLAIVAMATAFTMSANRLVAGPPPEDDAH
jgi:hypothetical protein